MATSLYPNAIDNTSSIPLASDKVTEVKAEIVNRIRDGLIAVQTELGINPSGTYGSIADRVSNIAAELGIQILQNGNQLLSSARSINFIGNGANLTTNSEGRLTLEVVGLSGGGVGLLYPAQDLPAVTDNQTVFTLEHIPFDPLSVMMAINGIVQEYNQDFTVSGNTVNYSGAALDSSDKVVFYYLYGSSGGSSGSIAVKEDGTVLSSVISTLNFGSGITAAVDGLNPDQINLTVTSSDPLNAPTNGSLSFKENSVDRLVFDFNGTSQALTISNDTSAFSFGFAQDPSAAGGTMSIRGQQGASGFIGGTLTLGGGDGGTPGTNKAGDTIIQLGTVASGQSANLSVYRGATELCRIYADNIADTKIQSLNSGNLILVSASSNFLVGNVNYLDSASTQFRDSGGAVRATLTTSTTPTLTFSNTATSVSFLHSQASSGNGANWLLESQQAASGSVGGSLTLRSGKGGMPGTNAAGELNLDVGASVSSVSSFINFNADSYRILTARRTASGSQISGGNPTGAAYNALIIDGSSLNLESRTTDISIVPAVNTYIGHAAAGNIYLREVGTIVATLKLDADSATSLTFADGPTSISFGQAQDASGIGAAWSIRAQKGVAGSIGGDLTIGGGDGGTPGTNRAGKTTIQLGQSVSGQSANLDIMADTTRIVTIRDRVGGSSLICAGDPDASRRPMLLEGSSVNLESTSTTVSLVAVSDLYFSSSGTYYFRKNNNIAQTWTVDNVGNNIINLASTTTGYDLRHNNITRFAFDSSGNVYLRADDGYSIGHRFDSASGAAKQEFFYGTVQTTDATPTTILAITVPAGRVVMIEADVVAYRDTDVVAAYKRIAAFSPTSETGNASQVGSTDLTFTAEDNASYDCTFSTSGTSALIQGTGVISSTVRWECHARVTYGSA
jgi:hypothetical protein